MQASLNNLPQRRKIALGAMAALALISASLVRSYLGASGRSAESGSLTAVAKRGNLDIKVLEGGSMEAIESQAIRSEVKGEAKIITLIEAGTLISEKDVAEGLVLVELDKSQLETARNNQEIQVRSLQASLIEAEQGYEIQVSANQSTVKAAEMMTRFAEMDFRKYLGEEFANSILNDTGLVAQAAQILNQNNRPESGDAAGDGAPLPILPVAGDGGGGGDAYPSPPAIEINSVKEASAQKLDFAALLDEQVPADGEARQLLRVLEDALLVAQEEHRTAKTKFEGTQRLADRNYVTATELDTDRVGLTKAEIGVESAQSALDLFRKYDFPKTAEERFSKYEDQLMATERAKRTAASLLAQANAKLDSAQSQLGIAMQTMEDLEEQLEHCTIRAERTGYVVYGDGSNDTWRYENVEEGGSVHERQQILTIPDMTKMSVKVKVHESAVTLVKEGMTASIRIDAYKDRPLSGKVVRVAVMPAPQNQWLNPEVKVFEVLIGVDGAYEWIRQGMSAQVELLVEQLVDVIYVPLPAVQYFGETAACFVKRGSGHERREVKTGPFNDEFVQIVSGLEVGEIVLLRTPPGEEARTMPVSEEPLAESAV